MDLMQIIEKETGFVKAERKTESKNPGERNRSAVKIVHDMSG